MDGLGLMKGGGDIGRRVSVGRGMASSHKSQLVEANDSFDYAPTVFDIRCIGVQRTNPVSIAAMREMLKQAYAPVVQ